MIFGLSRSNTCATIANTGNSISGPMTKASATIGWSENAVMAMARATGELRAIIVKCKLTESSYDMFNHLHKSCPNPKFIMK